MIGQDGDSAESGSRRQQLFAPQTERALHRAIGEAEQHRVAARLEPVGCQAGTTKVSRALKRDALLADYSPRPRPR